MALVKGDLKFKKIELEDLAQIKQFCSNYEPYSDFNALSIWTYNTKDLAEYYFYNNNLVIKFTDYLTSEIFLTLLGTTEIGNTLTAVFNYARENKIDQTLKLIPEITANIARQDKNSLEITEDPDNFDYIFSFESIMKLEGSHYKDERNLCHNFIKSHPNNQIDVLDINDRKVKTLLSDIYNKWISNKTALGKDEVEKETELTAFNRLLRDAEHFEVVCLGLKVNNEYIAFTISEPIGNGFVMAAFTKADINYRGSFQFIDQKRAECFYNLGYKFLNLEQDLGIPGLRQAKRSWNPVDYLKKYVIRSRAWG